MVQSMLKIWSGRHFEHFAMLLGVIFSLLFTCCSCVFLCYLLYFQLKLRSPCRLLVLCFVWASSIAFCLYGVASVSSVSAVALHFKVVLFKRLPSCGFMSFFWVLFSELVSFNSGSEYLSASRTISLCLSLFLSVSVSFTLSDGVWFAFLNSLPSPPPSLALLTNSRSPPHVEPTL